ncbi:MAG: nicotinate-nucleotide diphosphorylase (carboxylating), partial [Pedococcus sp.]
MTDRHSTDLQFPETDAQAVIRIALDEDLGGHDGVDVTTTATIPVEQVSSAHVVAREDGALAGIPVIAMVFDEVARRMGAEPLRITTKHRDGDIVSKGDIVAELAGST